MPSDRAAPYTTVMNWTANRDLEYGGETWGQKNVEMTRILALPTRVPEIALAVAVGQTTGAPFPRREAEAFGWRVLDPQAVAPNWHRYATFIAGSRGELSVAKETYVKARTGWFSCRSACYLAAGRPVVTQDTGWSHHIPTGRGLFAFDDIDGAADALRTIERDPETHARAARRIAEEHFDARIVLGRMLTTVGA
jgi:glycosyltransferase involved in cell wall biosynthesis